MSDDFGQKLLQLVLVRALEGESQIAETIKWDRETKGWVPLVQAGGAAVGITAILLGLGLLGWGAARMIQMEISALDALLAGVLLCLLLGLSVGLARWVFKVGTTPVVVGFGVLVAVLILAAVLSALASDGLDMAAGMAIGLAPPVLVAGGALAYRQMVDLLDPFGKTSPVERGILPHVPQLFTGSQEGARRVTVPYRLNGRMREPVAAGMRDGEPIVDVHREDLALVEFIQEAERRGLARRSWLVKGQPNVVLPRSGMEVGRDAYDALIANLVEWGFVAPGGDGTRAYWRMRPAEAIEVMEREFVAQLMAGE